MYENLLANVPTDLWIGGKWRKSSDGGRFDVLDPATESKIASVASATVEDAKAAVDAASDAFEGWAGRKPRERAEVLRKSFDLIMRDAERVAQLHHNRERQGATRFARRGRLRRRVLPLVRRGSGAGNRRGIACTCLRRPHRRPAQARGRRGAGDAMEFPRRHGYPQDRACA